MKRKLNIEVWMLALGIALFPPIWAVIAPHFGIQTGAVALICAGVYVTNGNKKSDAIKISIGFLLGDAWAVIALKIMDMMKWNPDMELFITLFVLGGLAVLISAMISQYIFCPAWLCGWAIGLTILSPIGLVDMKTIPFQIAIAMLVGVWYVGVFIDHVQKKAVTLAQKKKNGEKKNE